MLRNQDRQKRNTAMLSKILILLLIFSSCSHHESSGQLLVNREAISPYKIGERTRPYPEWVSQYYDLEVSKKLKEPGLLFKGDASSHGQLFIIDSGTRLTRAVACNMVRANGLEKMANYYSSKLVAQYKGKAFDIYFLGDGLSVINKILREQIKKESIQSEYFEERIWEGTSLIKERRGFNCAILVQISEKTLAEIKKELINGLKSQFFHLPSLEEDLNALSL